MKLHQKREHVERCGVRNESAFTIKTTAKAFDILSSGLYTDPIAAVIRELSCNAYDAHVAAGKPDVPFTLHLPNNLEPFFSITDYGIGLSDEQIQGQAIPVMTEMEVENEDGTTSTELVPVLDDEGNQVYNYTGGLYTTYFDSTKSDSNDFIGALGLGSKSPFSYTSAFDVISRYNGTKSIYSIFLNEDGIPTVALMGQTPTEESNGIEVRLAIEENDFGKFEKTTASILRYFPIKPTVVGVLNFSFIELPKIRLGGEKWFVAQQQWNTSAFTAVQGNVPYRVDINQIRDQLDPAIISFLSKASVVTYFNIGELDVAANREEIRYDDSSKAVLIERMQQIRKDLIVEIEKEADKLKDCFWDACIKLNKFSSNLFGYEGTIRTIINRDGTKSETLNRYVSQMGRVHPIYLRGHEMVLYKDKSSWKRNNISRHEIPGGMSFDPDEEIVVMYNDVNASGIRRIKQHMIQTTNYRSVLMIQPRKEPKAHENEPFEGYDKELERLIESLGNPEIQKVSEATEPVKNNRTIESFPLYVYSGVTNKSKVYWRDRFDVEWTRLSGNTINTSAGGLYFFIKHKKKIITTTDQVEVEVAWDAEEIKPTFMQIIDLINKHKGTSYTFGDLYGVTNAARNKLIKQGNWFDIFDMFRSVMPSVKDSVEHVASMSKTSNVLGVKDLIHDTQFVEHVEKLDENSPFRQSIESMIKSYAEHSQMIKTASFVRSFDYDYGDRIFVDVGKKFFDDSAFKEYPMLSLIGTLQQGSQNWTALFDYIKLIDRS